MRAVILAAGQSGRLRGVIGARSKCLTRVGDLTLLERQIEAIRGVGIEQLTVITGYDADGVRRACELGVDVVHNARYASTNSLYSLWLARDFLTQGFVVFNCDVLFHRALLADLIDGPHGDAVLVCRKAPGTVYSEEEMKVSIRHGRVVDMGKALPPEAADGENLGIARFSAQGAAVLVDTLTALVSSGQTSEWLPRAFAEFARRRPLHVVESGDRPWIEIDMPEDYWRACREVLPAIERTGGATSRDHNAAATPSAPATPTTTPAVSNGRSIRYV